MPDIEIINKHLDLHFPNEGPEQDARTQIGWCLSKEGMEDLLELNTENQTVYIILFVIDDQHKVRRHVARFDQYMTLIYFYRPGRHRIHATLFWSSKIKLPFQVSSYINSIREDSLWNGRFNDSNEWITNTRATLEHELLGTKKKRVNLVESQQRITSKLSDESYLADVETQDLTEVLLKTVSAESLGEKDQKNVEDLFKKVSDIIDMSTQEAYRNQLQHKLDVIPQKIEEQDQTAQELEAAIEKEVGREAMFNTGYNEQPYLRRYSYDEVPTFGYALSEINVQVEFFAKPLSDFEQWWLNWGHADKDKLKQGCDVRRRRVFAYSIKPLLVLPLILLRFIIRFIIAFNASVLQARPGVRWSPIWHPFAQVADSITLDAGQSLVTHNREGKKRSGGFSLELCKPVYFFGLACLYLIFDHVGSIINESMKIEYEGLLSTAFIMLIMIPVVGLFFERIVMPVFERILQALIGLCDSITILQSFKSWNNNRKAINREKEKERAAIYREMAFQKSLQTTNDMRQKYQSLLCDTGITPMPGQTTTVDLIKQSPMSNMPRLVYEGIKGKVCKPYAE